MKTLLWKDLRLNRPILIVVVLFFALPYLVPAGVNVFRWWNDGETIVTFGFITSSVQLSLFWSLLTMTVLVGNALALEREDRSAEFLAWLPPTRWTVMASKSIVIGAMIFVVFGFNLLAIYGLIPRLSGVPIEDFAGVRENLRETFLDRMVMATLMIGVAWFCSSIMKKASYAVGVAWLSPIVLGNALKIAQYVFKFPNEWIDPMFLSFAVGLGVGGMVAGSFYYLRRYEA